MLEGAEVRKSLPKEQGKNFFRTSALSSNGPKPKFIWLAKITGVKNLDQKSKAVEFICNENCTFSWQILRRVAALSPGAPPPNGPRGRRPTAAGPAGRSAAARRPPGRLRPGGAPPPNGRRVFSSLGPSRGVHVLELDLSFRMRIGSPPNSPGLRFCGVVLDFSSNFDENLMKNRGFRGLGRNL